MLIRNVCGSNAASNDMTNNMCVWALRDDDIRLKRTHPKRSPEADEVSAALKRGERRRNTLRRNLMEKPAFVAQSEDRDIEAPVTQRWNQDRPLALKTTNPKSRTYEQNARAVVQAFGP